MNKIWTVWKYAVGSFSDEQTEEYDNVVAVVRTFIVGINIVCAFFIMANIVHNWWYMSKGSKRRPQIVNDKQFQEAWDNIFPRRKTPTHGVTQVHTNKKKKNNRKEVQNIINKTIEE